MPKHRVVTDIELIGDTFLVVCLNPATGKFKHFWHRDREEFNTLLYKRSDITFVGFNSESFDAPLIEAWQQGHTVEQLRLMADAIISTNSRQWQTVQEFSLGAVTADWIDLKEPAPGVMISLKVYEGRMHFPTMQDLPFDHTMPSLDESQRKLLLQYCRNDVLATSALLKELDGDIALREAMGFTYGLDLRSKSGAQIAKSVLCKVANIGRQNSSIPKVIKYKTPAFVKTNNRQLNEIIERLENCQVEVNPANGAPVLPDFLKDPVEFLGGVYKMGIGGLHSQHDTEVHYQQSQDQIIVDIDCGSFYPSLMLKAGIFPKIEQGAAFVKAYREIVEQRLSAKARLGEVQKRIAEIEGKLKHVN